jgi:hypothetical protein
MAWYRLRRKAEAAFTAIVAGFLISRWAVARLVGGPTSPLSLLWPASSHDTSSGLLMVALMASLAAPHGMERPRQNSAVHSAPVTIRFQRDCAVGRFDSD